MRRGSYPFATHPVRWDETLFGSSTGQRMDGCKRPGCSAGYGFHVDEPAGPFNEQGHWFCSTGIATRGADVGHSDGSQTASTPTSMGAVGCGKCW
ncbi:Uncharacterised protein [Chlamydia trachomatis]|nr:Uncharacterised protein [Chlamydia trachomatis]